jgi:hypothetical protein
MFCGLGLELWHNEELPFDLSDDEGGNVSAGLDNSEQKAEGEAASGQTEKNRDVFTTSERSDVAQPLNKITSPLSIADEVALCPDIDSLKALYNRVQLKLSAEDRQLFTRKKQELLNG